MKKLAIAEKPSLARNIATGISLKHNEKFRARKGYLESDSFVVSWTFGHLYELVDLEDYDPSYDPEDPRGRAWNLNDLPFTPHNFQFKFRPITKSGGRGKPRVPDEGVVEQLETLKTLIHRNDIESIIHVGDAGREGTMIVNLVLDELGNTKPVDRLWSSVQTPEALAEALDNMKPIEAYELDYEEGLTRTYMDWLEGINFTRYVTIRAGSLFRIGRVITPIVSVIDQRRKDIDNFVPETYYNLESQEETKGEKVRLVSEIRIDDKGAADSEAVKYNAEEAKVTDIKRKQTEIKPPRLFSQTTLQNFMAKEYKFDPARTLAAAQVLYDNGYISYPRTGAQFLSEKEIESTRKVFNKLADPELEFDENNLVFNDRALGEEADHTAIIPTGETPKLDVGSDEEKLYKAVLNRFRSNFLREKCLVDRTDMIISVGNLEDFKLRGDVLISSGWRGVENVKTKEETLPNLELGDIVNIDFSPVEKQTKAPGLYTVSSLNSFLENPFGKIVESEDSDLTEEEMDLMAKATKEGLTIGTEATRAGIIDNAIKQNYISLKGGRYDIEEAGVMYMKMVNLLDINLSPKRTAEMERDLKRISRGEMEMDEVLSASMVEIHRVMNKNQDTVIEKINDFYKELGFINTKYGNKKIIGGCHFCKGSVIESPKAISCFDCGATAFISNNFLKALGLKPTKTHAVNIITKGEVKSNKFVSKKGKNYSATVKAKYEPKKSKFIEYDLKFDTKKKKGGR